MIKICCECKKEKPIEEFPPSKGVAHGHSRCRPCKQEYDRQYHQKRDSGKKVIKREKQILRERQLKKFVWDYKATHPCIDCGNSNPIVLEFDHNDGVVKLNDICSMAKGYSLANIKAEIEKCVIRCANCHRIRTHKQFGWFNGSEEDG